MRRAATAAACSTSADGSDWVAAERATATRGAVGPVELRKPAQRCALRARPRKLALEYGYAWAGAVAD